MNDRKEKGDCSNSIFVKDFLEAAELLSVRGWAERNAGNMSCIIPEAEAKKYFEKTKSIKRFYPEVNARELAGKILLVTATGSYFRKLRQNPARVLGALKVSEDGKGLDLLWGFEGDNSPTSEIGMHLMGHSARLKTDPDHRVIIHTHATNTIVMSAREELDEKGFTEALWRMHSECIVVFPDGIGVLPWMSPGTKEISIATSEKFKEYRVVVWPLHGLIGAGRSVDEVMGLIETVEKNAEIYVKCMGVYSSPRLVKNKQLMEIAKTFGVKLRKGIIDSL